MLCQLGYEDPYFQGASLPVKGMKHEVDVKFGNTNFYIKIDMIIAVLIPIQAITNTPESLLSVRYILWHFPRENENFASSMSAIKVLHIKLKVIKKQFSILRSVGFADWFVGL